MSLPKPFTFDQIVAVAGSHAEMLAALKECEEYFDQRADADDYGNGYRGNAAMDMLMMVRAAIDKAEASNV